MSTLERLKVHQILSVLVLGIGLVLMIWMMYAESEPGAIPLLLVLLGAGWYFVTRARTRLHRK